jgi:hypothetical protein
VWERFSDVLLDQMIDLHTAERADMHTVYVALLSYDAETRAPPDDIMGIATGTTREDLRQGWMGLGAVVTYMDQVELGEPDYPPEYLPGMVDYLSEYLDCPRDVAEAYFRSRSGFESSYKTLVQEIGHTLTLHHVTSTENAFPDSDRAVDFPRADGRIGLTGYDLRTDVRYMPQCSVDFMAYTAAPWTSDYTWKRLHEVLTDRGVSGFDRIVLPPQPHLVALVRLVDDAPAQGVEVRFGWRAPGGPSSAHRPVPVAALDSMGRLVSEVTARFVPFHEGRAGQLYVPEVPGAAAYRIETGGSPLFVDAVVAR